MRLAPTLLGRLLGFLVFIVVVGHGSPTPLSNGTAK
jgi:hypothetical protein